MKKYNLSAIMKAAWAVYRADYYKVFNRARFAQCLKWQWEIAIADAKKQEAVTVTESSTLMLTPDEFLPGDHVGIHVGALDGELRWYTFVQINREWDDREYVVDFGVCGNTIGFVIGKAERLFVERKAENIVKAA